MEVLLPPVFSIQESTPTSNLIRQIGVPASRREGQLANYTGDRVRGHLLVSEGLPELLIVPSRTRTAPVNQQLVIAADIDPTAQTQDLRNATWLSHPRLHVRNATPRDQVTAQVANSWASAFCYREEALDRGIAGLRKPQLGALHAMHMHWTVTNRTATIVMPTGTGKTDTMLSILVTRPCERLLVVVPTDALRTQLTDKFLTLGVLKQKGSYVPTDAERRNKGNRAGGMILFTETEVERIHGDLRILEILQKKDDQANLNLGDPGSFLNEYDPDKEVEKVANFMAQGLSPEQVESRLDATQQNKENNEGDWLLNYSAEPT